MLNAEANAEEEPTREELRQFLEDNYDSLMPEDAGSIEEEIAILERRESAAPRCQVPECRRAAREPEALNRKEPLAFCFTHWEQLTSFHRQALERSARLSAAGWESETFELAVETRAAIEYLTSRKEPK